MYVVKYRGNLAGMAYKPYAAIGNLIAAPTFPLAPNVA
jgi:hypothetical protein